MKRSNHGMTGTSEYQTYCDLKHKRGEQFQFRSFTEFIQVLGPRPQGMMIRRHDESKPYAPRNAYWGSHDGTAGANARRTHGFSRTPTYESYASARKRCTNPKCDCYDRYGALGIRMLFTSFAEFLRSVGSRPQGTSIDRSNPFGSYMSGNTSWKDARWQKLNQRDSNVNLLYRCIYEVLLDEGLTPAEASAQCVPIPEIERMKSMI